MSSPPVPSLTSGPRFSEVDGLRAIACALVIVSHTGNGRIHDMFVHILECGWLGVLMFFAISGFVIPDSLRGARWSGVKHFAVRRFWRLYPPFWMALLLTWWIDSRYSAEQWPWDAVMLPSLGVKGEAFIHFWTLEVELVFYCLVAALFFIFGRLGWRVILPGYVLLALLAAMSFLAPDSAFGNNMILLYLVVMFFGGLCREVLRFDFSRWRKSTQRECVCSCEREKLARSIVLGLISGSTLVVLLIASSAMRISGRSFEIAALVSILGFLFWVIFIPARIGWLSKVGRWTYSTYLLHQLAILVSYWLVGLSFFGSFSRIPLFFTGFVLVVSFAIGAVAYRWIEQPSDAIGKRLAARLGR